MSLSTTMDKRQTYEASSNATYIFRKRFVQPMYDGTGEDAITNAIIRVSKSIATAENTIALQQKYENIFFNLIASKRFIPNSPTWTGANTALGQLSACFVLPIIDDIGKERSGVFDTLKDAVLIHQAGGGTGFNFSNIRPQNDYVGEIPNCASGPVKFLKSYDASLGNIIQGGMRKGGNMAILDVHHPDILEFL